MLQNICHESNLLKSHEELNKHINDDVNHSPIKTIHFQNEGKKLYDKGLELLDQFIHKFKDNLQSLKLNLKK